MDLTHARAAFARRLFNLSRSVEHLARNGRGIIDRSDLRRAWRLAEVLHELARDIAPQPWPDVPDRA